MVYNIGKIYDTYVKDRQQTNLEGTAKEAEELISSSIESNSLAIVQGPPGTGKTTLYYNVIENSLDNLDENEVIVYTAPSNRLVADMLKRICKLFPDKKNFLDEVRVYGSQFDYTEFESLRGQITKNVKLVITTDYQRIFFSREFKSQDYLSRFHMLIDEASRSPLHREFTPIAEELLRNGKQILGSLNVIGDPMQAISLTEFYRISRREYLLMEKILMKLMEHDYPDIYKNIINNKISLMDAVYNNPPKSFYKFLDTTRRLPIPTQEIISYAYYGGLLKSAVDGEKVIKEINWNVYKINIYQEPVAFFVHICSTKIPYKTLGKEYIANQPEIYREIELSLRKNARNLSSYLNKKRFSEYQRERKKYLSEYIEKIVYFAGKLAEIDYNKLKNYLESFREKLLKENYEDLEIKVAN